MKLRKKEESKIKRVLRACKIILGNPLLSDRIVAAEAGLKIEEVRKLKTILADLKMRFPNKKETWIIRAGARSLFVEKISKKHWLVKGFKELGDYYEAYHVTKGPDNKYHCSCHTHTYGYVREKKICTHIGAVIAYRA
ncbi:MAG: hypothetical protein DRJ52_10355 [Thermoprotei archaeon]|nr:MAG: hypothetical protein DRJ52_10355 [Thermoprotei archaeon]